MKIDTTQMKRRFLTRGHGPEKGNASFYIIFIILAAFQISPHLPRAQ